ncbi:hypothetical protein BC351_18745 [Paenibacillus ferrarius]|uniref:Ricin B lectin domain-containing protein n=1 Tax=Paenibacillus ferrarius TaxID=1469647 RepID=A0A1V4HPT7_9BACL|nr:hypothetical protein BC351_18745 [Paenibacillus ferrarius]
MDVNGASTSDGAPILFNGRAITGGTNSGKLLDMSGASTSDLGQAIQWYDNGGANQRWFFLS